MTFSRTGAGKDLLVVWVILLILLALVFGLGTVLEAALWVLLIIAAVVVVGALLGGRALGRL